MTAITFITHDERSHAIDAKDGVSVMENATHHDVPGIVALCGGACSCATCHVYVEPNWADKLEEASLLEREMLDFVLDPRPTSRLSCQIEVTAELDGLVLRVPEAQAE